ncbi:MAG: amidotransferase [Spirochaetaceae bacterium]|nr:MAG: amidotransferase [Spirochaetaceae bacterium]
MRAHYLQHVPFEGLGSIEPWLTAAGYELSRTAFFEQQPLPSPADIDLLIVMGGPMSVNDEQLYPWLAAEKQFIGEAIRLGKSVLGICLGAQLIAAALGARVYPNGEKEIGWFPVQILDHGAMSALGPAATELVFHWHGETFDLPSGARLLAESTACTNQAFQLGPSVIGLQFHLETTPQAAKDIVENSRDELVPARFVQSEAQILSAAPECYAAVNRLMENILGYLHRP